MIADILQNGPNLRERLFRSHSGTCGECVNIVVEPTYCHCPVLYREQDARGVRVIADHVAKDTPACGAFNPQFTIGSTLLDPRAH